jgi:F-type H+-transporting ATPase subunit a
MAGGVSLFNSLGIAHEFHHVAGAALTAGVVTVAGVVAHTQLKNTDQMILPEGRFTFVNALTSLVSYFRKLLHDIVGHHSDQYVPLVVSIFIFILMQNYSGLIPGIPPATENLNTNLAVALLVFVFYQFLGFKEHGFGYLKQFTGGLPPAGMSAAMTVVLSAIAMLVLVIELVGHMFRPVSMSLRLWGNINGDHILFGTVMQLIPIGLPMAVLALGMFVGLIQAFVFSLLTTVYIKLAVSHDH